VSDNDRLPSKCNKGWEEEGREEKGERREEGGTRSKGIGLLVSDNDGFLSKCFNLSKDVFKPRELSR
jgi:hypothetical protein